MLAFYLRASDTCVRKSRLFRWTFASDTLIPFFFPVGAIIIGRISDRTVIKWRTKRGGVWFPEDRLRASLIAFAIIVPVSVLAFGLVNQFVEGRLGLVLSLVCLFFCGVGVREWTMIYMANMQKANWYYFLYIKIGGNVFRALRGVSGRRNAFSKCRKLGGEYVCSFKSFKFLFFADENSNDLYSAFRAVLVAMATAVALPMIDMYGIVITNALCAVLVWLSFGYVIVLKRKKKDLANNDIG